MQPGYAWGEDGAFRNSAPLGADPMFPELAAAMREQERARQQDQIIQQMHSPTGFSALAKMASAWLTTKGVNDAEAKVQNVQQGMSQQRQAELARVMQAITGQAEQPGPPTATGERSMANVGTNPQEQMAALLSARDPAFRDMGVKLAAAQLIPKAPKVEHVDLGDAIGIIRDGQLVGTMPKGVTPDARFGKTTVSADTAANISAGDWRHTTPTGDARLSDARSREQFSGVSGNTAYTQGQENARFGAMPVETGQGFVRRDQAPGMPGKPAAGGAPDREYDNARQTYSTIYGSAYFGIRNAPKFEDWLKTDWPRIRSAGGMAPQGGAGPNPGIPAAATPGRGAGGPITTGAPPAPPNPADRQPGAVYQTPKGPLRWMGNGWQPAS